MKKIIVSLIFAIVLLSGILFTQVILAQAPPPPPTEKGTSSNKAPGGGAPVDGGLTIVLAMVAGYGAWRYRRSRQND
jgi:hypothetical protein